MNRITEETRYRRLHVTVELLVQMLGAGIHHPGGYTITGDGIPEDAKLVNVRHAWPNNVDILFESASFEPNVIGAEVPALVTRVTVTAPEVRERALEDALRYIMETRSVKCEHR